jgi:diguanylate cyclase (GGDEF)-like protein
MTRFQGWSAVVARFSGARTGAKVSAIILDIDWFMAFNDSYGSAAGDALLANVEKLIVECIENEPDARCIRVGGEEFVVLLHDDATTQYAVDLAEKVRTSLAALNLPFVHEEVRTSGRVTLSAGVSTASDPRTLRDNLEGTLQRAKVGGRNQVAS